MRLKRITTKDPMKRFYISFHQSFLDLTSQYAEAYQATYGDELPLNQMVEEIVRSFINADPDFKKYLADREKSEKASKTAKPAEKTEKPAADAEKPADKEAAPAKRGFLG